MIFLNLKDRNIIIILVAKNSSDFWQLTFATNLDLHVALSANMIKKIPNDDFSIYILNPDLNE